MNVWINGEEQEIDVSTLEEVVKHYNLEKSLVVTEIDGTIIDRDQWRETTLQPGMKIELVHFVGGG